MVMCDRACLDADPDIIHSRFGSGSAQDVVRSSRGPVEVVSRGNAYVIRTEHDRRMLDEVSWNVLRGRGKKAVIHLRTMMTILREADWDRWLSGSHDDGIALQRPCPVDQMAVRRPVLPTRS